MDATRLDEPDEPPHPSFDELQRSKGITSTDAMRRVYWPLQGEFPLNMSVMKKPREPSELEPLFQPGSSGNDTWHEIASQPITRPKVSSIKVRVPELDQWGPNWKNYHGEHASAESGAEYVTEGDLDDDIRDWEADSDAKVLIRCCGQDRPLRKQGRTITVVPSAGSDFVTVRDYICAVHPWLMSLRDDIVKSKNVNQFELASNLEELMVSNRTGPRHEIMGKDLWMRLHRPLPAISGSNAVIYRNGRRVAP